MAGRLISQGEIEHVGYYFTSYRGRGERIKYRPADLDNQGRKILASLSGMVIRGAYPATTDDKDCTYCDYKKICGDTKKLAARMKQMLKECHDEKLDSMRSLRQMEADDEQ